MDERARPALRRTRARRPRRAARRDRGDRARGRIVFVNELAAELFGYAREELVGRPVTTLWPERVARALARSAREQRPTGVLFIDLDDFKAVNDRLGHAAGDAVLAELASRLRAAVRPADTVARLGGDEFVVVCEDVDCDAATALGRRMEEAIRQPLALDGIEHRLTASIGIALGDGDADGLLAAPTPPSTGPRRPGAAASRCRGRVTSRAWSSRSRRPMGRAARTSARGSPSGWRSRSSTARSRTRWPSDWRSRSPRRCATTRPPAPCSSASSGCWRRPGWRSARDRSSSTRSSTRPPIATRPSR